MMDVGLILPPTELTQKFGTGIDLNGFYALMNTAVAHDDKEADLVEAFKVFDKDGSGRMQITELRYVLCALGDKLDSDQAEEIIGQISTRDGYFDCQTIIRQYQ